MKLRSGRRIVRRKNIYLPTEVWVDIFCYPWITRRKLAQMVDRIGNHWFTEQLQFYLHEWGKHTLDHLRFTNQRIINHYSNQYDPLEHPQIAMPENIKFCKTFQIEHFDNRVFNFFRRIQSLLTADTKLDIRYIYKDEMDNARTILGHLLPLIDGVHTIKLDDWMMPIVKSFPPEKFDQIKVFNVHLNQLAQSAMEPIMEWLTSSSNEPKLLQLRCFNGEIGQVLETIRKQFMEATEPSTFAIILSYNLYFPAFQSENAIGEQLCGMANENIYGKFKVFRHQANNAEAGNQLRQWVDGNTDEGGMHDRKQYICFFKPTIGDGPIFAMPDIDEADEKEDDDAIPSSSKKRRICE